MFITGSEEYIKSLRWKLVPTVLEDWKLEKDL